MSYSVIDRNQLRSSTFNTLPDDAQLLYFKIIAHPLITSVGALPIGLRTLGEFMNWSDRKIKQNIAALCDANLIKLDKKAHVIYRKDHFILSKINTYATIHSIDFNLNLIPDCDLKCEIVDEILQCLRDRKWPMTRGLEEKLLFTLKVHVDDPLWTTTPEPHAEHAINKQVTINKRTNNKKPNTPLTPLGGGLVIAEQKVSLSDSVQNIFNYWREVMNHPGAKLDERRKRIIKKALADDYTENDLCQAIHGCSVTSWNMTINENGQRYDGIDLILRNADQIDRFMHNSLNPPRHLSKTDMLMIHNYEASKGFLDMTEEELFGKKESEEDEEEARLIEIH